MRVFIVRHAQAAAGEPDELRPLTEVGRETARELGSRLAANGIRPDAIVTSPLLRARQTGDEIGRAVGVEAEPDDRLAPGASAADVRAATSGRGDSVLVVGHQPDCGRAAAALGDGSEPAFPPAGMAVVELE